MRLAVIPARGGSKRIPRKNVRLFAGKPMIVWSIEAARASGLFDDVIVSTDDEEIAVVAREAGASTPFMRPAQLSDDHAGTLEVMTHAAAWAVEAGLVPQSICCLYATAPFVQPGDLAEAHAILSEGEWDYVFTAARYSFPIQRAFVKAPDEAMRLLLPEFALTRSQDLAPAFHDAGQFYWGRAEAWLAAQPIYGPRTTFIALPPERVQDIDTPEDWQRAEEMFASAAAPTKVDSG